MYQRKNPSLGVNPAKTPRNAFDLSERHLYTQAPGMLLPVFVKDMNPDEKISIDVASQLQAMTLKGRAFANMQQQFAAYFVPYRYLWSYWDSFITGLSTRNTVNSSSLMTSASPTELVAPTFKPYKVGMENSAKIDALGFSFLTNYVRLNDLLGYGNLVFPKKPFPDNSVNRTLEDYSANAFRWLAYQKIYFDHFLDDRFETRDVKSWNADYTSSSNGLLDFSYSETFQMRYAKYNRDLLSSIQPSPLFISDVDSKIKSYVGDSVLRADTSDTNVDIISSTPDGSTLSLSAATIRNLFALDKMAQISSRAAKTYRAQMLAHYGVNVNDDNHLSKYCGGFSRDLDTTSVIATSDGQAKDSSTNFGQQGGFIDSVNGGHIEFDSRGDFGVFMILSWISPNPIWDSDGIDPFNCKLRKEDYYHPEFADLGMQPLTTNYINNLSFDKSGSFGNPGSSLTVDDVLSKTKMAFDSSKVYGWTERYAEYKSSYDKCHGEFKKSYFRPDVFPSSTIGSLSFLTHHSSTNASRIGANGGVFSPTKGVSLNNISIRPDVLNDVVEVEYKGYQFEDPFRVQTFFRCSMLRNMSVSGLPRL